MLVLVFSVRLLSASEDRPNLPINDVPFYFEKAEKIDAHTTRIPFELVDRLIVIQGNYKEKTGGFIIDTGAEKLIFNTAHFKQLPLGGKKQYNVSGVLDYVDNPIQKRIQEVNFNDLSVVNKKTDLVDLSHIEKSKHMHLLGIIGYNVLKDYEVFVDLHLQQITLKKTDRKGKVLSSQPYLEAITDTINFSLKKHSIVLEGFVDKKKATFGLDTGAEYNQIDSRIGKKALKNFYPKKRIKLIGASKSEAEVLYGSMYRIKLNDSVYFGPMKTILTNLKNIEKAFGVRLDGILGYDFFAQKRVIINYKKQQLYFIDYPYLRK